jgi:hypothetical protein
VVLQVHRPHPAEGVAVTLPTCIQAISVHRCLPAQIQLDLRQMMHDTAFQHSTRALLTRSYSQSTVAALEGGRKAHLYPGPAPHGIVSCIIQQTTVGPERSLRVDQGALTTPGHSAMA